MPAGFDIEVITHGPEQLKILPISAHVQKYTEQFVYTKKIPNINTPIAYFETDPIDSWANIQLVDQTHVIPENSQVLIDQSMAWVKVASNSFTIPYKSVAITNHYILDEYGKEKPLFFKHVLPKNTVEAHIHVYDNGDEATVETGLLVDYERGCIWTNYQNYYNPDTGAYKLYFVTSVSNHEDGEVTNSHVLLNPVPAIGQSSWQDVDMNEWLDEENCIKNPNYGKIVGVSFSSEEVAGGFRFDIAGHEKSVASTYCDDIDAPVSNHDIDLSQGMGAGNYYIKPLEDSNIKLILPSGRTPEDNWHLKVTNGHFFKMMLGRLRKFWVPEFDYQPFSPAAPYVFSPYRKLIWANAKNLASTRKHIAIDPNDNRDLRVFVYDKDDNLVHMYSTDLSLHNKKYTMNRKTRVDKDGYAVEEIEKTEILIDADPTNPPILSWDNRNGIINFGRTLDPSHTYYGSYFYEAKDYEYSTLTLNPLQHREALTHVWVFYIIPDAHRHDKAVHCLGVDEEGLIVYCSQGLGRSHPNLQLLNEDGSYNTDTVIGMKYQSMVDSNNFKNNYCVPYINSSQYYILGEASVMDIGDEEDTISFDVRRDGAIIQKEYFEEAIRANPKILQSALGYGPDGQVVPENSLALIKPPLTLLNEFGGVLDRSEAEELLQQYMPAATTGIIDWDYTSPVLEGWSPDKGLDGVPEEYKTPYVELRMTWEGPGLEYAIYRKESLSESWFQTGEHLEDGTPVIREPIVILSTGNDRVEEMVYNDLDVKPGKTYFYGVQVIENGIKLPIRYAVGISVRDKL